MVDMGVGMTKGGRGPWWFPLVGAATGLALGILVSLTTDVPLAPEAGLVIGFFVGWLWRRVRD
jgi:cobalamin synthase